MVDLFETARACYLQAVRGAGLASAELIGSLAANGGRTAALWRIALAAESFVQTGSLPAGVSEAELVLGPPPTSGAEQTAMMRAAESLARLHSLRFAADGLRHLSRRVHELSGKDARATIVAGLIDARRYWLSPEGPAPELEAQLRSAQSLKLPALTVETESLRALLALSAGETELAVSLARRASRMGKAEGIPGVEVLANVVLARVRRHQNLPHLTLRILGALQRHAPHPWRGWIAWEMAMAGGTVAPDVDVSRSRLNAFVDSVGLGDADAASAASQELLGAEMAAPLRRDAELAVALLSLPMGSGDESLERLAAWRRGDEDELPAGVVGLAFGRAADPTSGALSAAVVARPAKSFRIPQATVRLAEQVLGLEPEAATSQPRADSGLSLLALSQGQPVPKTDYFRRLYGFDFDPDVHAAILRMHVGRMRTRLGDGGTVESDDAHIRLVLERTVILQDPRCVELLPQRALRALAQRAGGLSARDLSLELSVPLRTAQRTLKELVGDGALTSKSKGRAIVYEVEDTTFSEPTMSQSYAPQKADD